MHGPDVPTVQSVAILIQVIKQPAPILTVLDVMAAENAALAVPGEAGLVAPGSVAMSVDEEWGLKQLANSSGDEFKTRLLTALRGACQSFGGPRQFLEQRYGSEHERKSFAANLLRLFPMDDTVAYHTSYPVPEITEDKMSTVRPITLHISCFSYDRRASTKMPPGESLTMDLAAEILNDGFVTAGDEVKTSTQCVLPSVPSPWLTSGQTADQHVPAQSVGYTKGQARVLTLLAMIGLCMEDNIDSAFLKKVLGRCGVSLITTCRTPHHENSPGPQTFLLVEGPRPRWSPHLFVS